MKHFLIPLAVLLCLSCKTVEPEGFLTDFSGTNLPLTTINETNDIYETSSVSISWSGNEHAFSFSHRLEPLSYLDTVKTHVNWTEWGPATTVTYANLDEGEYNFHIKSRYTIDIEETPQIINFMVNAFSGTTLRIYPLHQQVSAGESFDMYIYIENVVDLGGLELHLSHPSPTMITNSITSGAILSNSSIFFNTINPTDGTIELISTGANFSGFTGSGIIAKISLTAGSSTGQNTLYINDTSILRNSENVQIDIVDKVHGLIEVVE